MPQHCWIVKLWIVNTFQEENLYSKFRDELKPLFGKCNNTLFISFCFEHFFFWRGEPIFEIALQAQACFLENVIKNCMFVNFNTFQENNSYKFSEFEERSRIPQRAETLS